MRRQFNEQAVQKIRDAVHVAERLSATVPAQSSWTPVINTPPLLTVEPRSGPDADGLYTGVLAYRDRATGAYTYTSIDVKMFETNDTPLSLNHRYPCRPSYVDDDKVTVYEVYSGKGDTAFAVVTRPLYADEGGEPGTGTVVLDPCGRVLARLLDVSNPCSQTQTATTIVIAPLEGVLYTDRPYVVYPTGTTVVVDVVDGTSTSTGLLGTIEASDTEYPLYIAEGESSVGDVTMTIYRSDCVNGRVYRYKQTLTNENNQWTKGPWLFDTLQGCCDCTDIDGTATGSGTGTLGQCWCGVDLPPETIPACITFTTTLPWYWQGAYRHTITISGVARRYGLGLNGIGPPWGYYLSAPTGPEDLMAEDDAPRQWTVQWSVSCQYGQYTPSALSLNYSNVSDVDSEQGYSAEATSESISCPNGAPCFVFTYENMPGGTTAEFGFVDAVLTVGDCAEPCLESVGTGETGTGTGTNVANCPTSNVYCATPTVGTFAGIGCSGYNTEQTLTWDSLATWASSGTGAGSGMIMNILSATTAELNIAYVYQLIAVYECLSWDCTTGGTFTLVEQGTAPRCSSVATTFVVTLGSCEGGTGVPPGTGTLPGTGTTPPP